MYDDIDPPSHNRRESSITTHNDQKRAEIFDVSRRCSYLDDETYEFEA